MDHLGAPYDAALRMLAALALGLGSLACGDGGSGEPSETGGTAGFAGGDQGGSNMGGEAGAGRGGDAGEAGGGRGGSSGVGGEAGAGRGGEAGEAGAGRGGSSGVGGGGAAGTGGSAEPCDGVTCSGHGDCTVQDGEAECSCNAGYENPPDEPTSCVDIDECTKNNGGCDPLTSCTNTAGGRTCGACPPDYEGDGETGCTPVCDGAPTPICPCIRVAPDGDDALAISSSGATPFRTVQTAIDYAAANRDVATAVCVAGGDACSASASYEGPTGGDLAMRDGVSVYGSYESTSWTRCDAITTELLPTTATGVSFGTDIEQATSLDRFGVEHVDAEGAAGVSIVGAVGARLVDLDIGGPAVRSPVGVDVSDGGDAAVFGSVIEVAAIGGSAFALRSVDSRVIVEQSTLSAEGQETELDTVLLERSPGSEVFECELESVRVLGEGQNPDFTQVVVIRVRGDAESVNIEGNSVLATGAGYGHVAIDIEACDGKSPRVFDNPSIRAGTSSPEPLPYGTSSGDGPTAIRVRGDCHPRIESNDSIVAGGSRTPGGVGIACTAERGLPSGCEIIGNADIHVASVPEVPASGTGILCSDGSCREIVHNNVRGLSLQGNVYHRPFYVSYGVRLVNASPLVDSNHIGLGCGVGAGLSGTARIQNNVIIGRTGCTLSYEGMNKESYAISGGGDVHSNYLDGAGALEWEPYCTSAAVGNASGAFRNNILVAGNCDSNNFHFVGFPGTLENNDFSPVGSPRGLIALTPMSPPLISTLSELEAYYGTNAPGNISAPCASRRSPNDACVDTGTAVGVPALDIDGDARGATPDIGPDEIGDFGQPCANVDCDGHGTCRRDGTTAACDCEPGYRKPVNDPLSCENVDECATDNGGCDPLTVCTDLPGSRSCGSCPSGYSGDGEIGCTPIAHCNPNPCQRGASCAGLPDTYACDCPPGSGGKDCELSFVEVAAGADHSCGLQSDGRVVCWGSTKPPPTGTFTTLDAGEKFTCGVRSDGTLSCWGDASLAQATPPAGTYTAIAAGRQHACALATGGAIVCFGDNSDGQATPPSGTFTALAAGADHNCSLRTDGTLSCWGLNTSQATPPSGTFTALAAGDVHTCAIASNATVVCWGSGINGQLDVPPGTYVAISAGGKQTCALRAANNMLTCWGDYTTGVTSPPYGDAFDQVTVGTAHACGVTSGGIASCWGDDGSGRATPPGGAYRTVASSFEGTCAIRWDQSPQCWGIAATKRVPSGAFTTVSAGLFHACAAGGGGAVCWGKTPDGQMTAPAPSGVFSSVGAGDWHSCGLRLDGTVACWGGLTGDWTHVPPGTFSRLGVAGDTSCVLGSSGTLSCWGTSLPIPPPPPLPPSGKSFVDFALGANNGCAIVDDGTLVCWGLNDFGVPSAPSGPFEAVSVGVRHACGIRADDGVECWGSIDSGALTPPAGAFVALASGKDHTCAIRSDRSLTCWGAQFR